MNIEISPQETLRYIEEANLAGIPHSFVQCEHDNSHNNTIVAHLLWEPDWNGPGLKLSLYVNGSWGATLLDVPSPGDPRDEA
jgi:hypothetical protein